LRVLMRLVAVLAKIEGRVWMITKKTAALGAAILIVITVFFSSFLTLTISRYIDIYRGDRVIISREQFELMEYFGRLDEVRKILERDHLVEPDREAMLTGAIKGMVEAMGDPYTYFFTPSEYRDFVARAQGTYGGIGLWVTVNEDDNMITVVRAFDSTPAMKAGIVTGDKIIRVEGQDVDGSSLEKAVGMMRGTPGTSVTVSILRNGTVSDFTLERAVIEIPILEHKMLQDNIGYIWLYQFNEKSAENFRETISILSEQGMEALLLDLRGNPGGLLEQCVQIADILLPEGVVVYSEDRQENREEYTSDDQHLGLPIVVLVDEFSASASEVLAGAIQDFGAGTLIGNTTFGKAFVQGIRGPFRDGSALKLTTSQYFTPSGRNIQDIGIKPDITVEMTQAAREFLEANPGTDLPVELDAVLQRGIDEILRKLEQ